MTKLKNAHLLPLSLPNLQNLIKRDSEAYKNEFILQWRHYQSLIEVFKLEPSQQNSHLEELINFISQVCQHFTDMCTGFSQELIQILRLYSAQLTASMRMTICKSLILLKNKKYISPVSLFELFFELFKCSDKQLRIFLQDFIVNDIKTMNKKRKNVALNTSLQNFMFEILKDDEPKCCKLSLDVMIELYRRGVWNDAKTVNIVSSALFSSVTKVMVAALTFFIGKDEPNGTDDDSSGDDSEQEVTNSAKSIVNAFKYTRKTKKKKKSYLKAKTIIHKVKKRKKGIKCVNFSALHLIYDPQSLVEKLYKKLEAFNDCYEIKLLLMDLIARLIGVHKLFLFNFYPYLQRFIQPKQMEVTRILQFAAQASHELVPPDILHALVLFVANSFVTERNSNEVITVGINSIKEICMRAPLAITEELLLDLSDYRQYNNKNVVMAARSLISHYRFTYPQLLHKKHRGRPTESTAELVKPEYGALKAQSHISGAEVLPTELPDVPDTASSHKNLDYQDKDEDIEVELVEEETEIESKTANQKSGRLTQIEKCERAQEVMCSRILTDSDFRRIEQVQLAKHLDPLRRNKRQLPMDDTIPGGCQQHSRSEIVSLSDIERLHKRPRDDKDTRLQTIKESKCDRSEMKFGRTKGRVNEFASTTNSEKRKKKPFLMLRNKLQRKTNKSFVEKQRTLRNSLLKKKNRHKY